MTTNKQSETPEPKQSETPEPVNTSDTPPKGMPTVDRDASTQIGQVIKGLGSKITEHLPIVDPEPERERERPSRKNQGQPSREQLAELVVALGNTEHPLHAQALDMLVEAGPAAVPLLKDSMQADLPWLTAYRASEALGRIGDGRATGALMQALRHPNSNVRWSAVRALALLGDIRALLELRRVANEDPGRTSWGESVAGAAHSALDQIQSQSVWSQSVELIKTALTSGLMILALILLFSVFTTLHKEVNQFGKGDPDKVLAQVAASAPDETSSALNFENQPELPPLDLSPMPEVTPTPIEEPTPEPEIIEEIPGTVLSGANVRPYPSVQNEPIGTISQGDEIFFVGISPDGMWYHIRLGENHDDTSSIENENGSGWVHRELLSTPKGDVVVEDPDQETETPAENTVEEPVLEDEPITEDEPIIEENETQP